MLRAKFCIVVERYERRRNGKTFWTRHIDGKLESTGIYKAGHCPILNWPAGAKWLELRKKFTRLPPAWVNDV